MPIIGIDDTDSERGLCTTYLAAVLMERLEEAACVFGLPRLVRLNPCARFKTRGNAAIAIHVETDSIEETRQIALQTLLELSDMSGANTNPGLVVADRVTPSMRQFYRQAVSEILPISQARSIIEEEGIWARSFKNGRGLIGALAACGSVFDDYTYELIAYRRRDRWGTPRQIDEDSVWRADMMTYPATWDTVDLAAGRIVFAPHSPDPVLFGIRGGDVSAINAAFAKVVSESPERSVLYITNQGTDAHILQGRIGQTVDDRSYRLSGTVKTAPYEIQKGHVFFTIQNKSSNDAAIEPEEIVCAAFEPTKGFRKIVRGLIPGDRVEVYGAVREGTLNIEKVEVKSLAMAVSRSAPTCKGCGRKMKSAGTGQGYRCRRCHTLADGPDMSEISRDIEVGFYEVPPSARRHLSLPLVRLRGAVVHPSR